MGIGVVRLDGGQVLELACCLLQAALTRKCHPEVVEGVAVVRIAVEGPLIFCDRLREPAHAVQHQPEVESRVGVVGSFERAAQNAFRYAFLLIFGTNARNLRGLSTMIWRSTSSLAPAAFSFGTKTVSVLAYPISLLLRLS